MFAAQCQGATQKGVRCTKPTRSGLFCHLHRNATTSSASQGNDGSPFRLADLPTELRLKIFNYLPEQLHIKLHRPSNQLRILSTEANDAYGLSSRAALLLSSRQAYWDMKDQLRLVIHGGAALRRFVSVTTLHAGGQKMRVAEVRYNPNTEYWLTMYMDVLCNSNWFGQHVPALVEV